MTISDFRNNVVVTAERGKYLKLLNNENSTEIIGYPVRIIFQKVEGTNIPEFEEIDL